MTAKVDRDDAIVLTRIKAEQSVADGALEHLLGQWLLNSSCPLNADVSMAKILARCSVMFIKLLVEQREVRGLRNGGWSNRIARPVGRSSELWRDCLALTKIATEFRAGFVVSGLHSSAVAEVLMLHQLPGMVQLRTLSAFI